MGDYTMKLETFETCAKRLLEKARDTHRTGKPLHAATLRGEALATVSLGCEAFVAERAALAALADVPDVEPAAPDGFRLENYRVQARKALKRAEALHRKGDLLRAEAQTQTAHALIAGGLIALEEAQERLARLHTEAAVQAVEDDAYVARLRDGAAA